MTVQPESRRAAARPFSRKRETGVALAIVVWFIAGMSLLVAGIAFLVCRKLRKSKEREGVA